MNLLSPSYNNSTHTYTGYSTAILDVPYAGTNFTLATKDRKSTRLNSSHLGIAYVVLYFKKWSGAPRDLHSFPTRRSSDLIQLTLIPVIRRRFWMFPMPALTSPWRR